MHQNKPATIEASQMKGNSSQTLRCLNRFCGASVCVLTSNVDHVTIFALTAKHTIRHIKFKL